MSSTRRTTFRIRRFTQGLVDPPRFEDFEVEAEPEESVLDVLQRIRLAHDPSLLYRSACHHGSCGTCGCTIDGVERLACVTKLGELDGEVVTVEPLSCSPCEGDLVVDTRGLYRDLSESWSVLRPIEGTEVTDDRSDAKALLRLEDCIECFLCVSACPATGGEPPFMGPAALAALHRELEKHPEQSPELRALAASNRGVALCQRAIDCSRRCPTGVAPARRIAMLRRALESPSE